MWSLSRGTLSGLVRRRRDLLLLLRPEVVFNWARMMHDSHPKAQECTWSQGVHQHMVLRLQSLGLDASTDAALISGSA